MSGKKRMHPLTRCHTLLRHLEQMVRDTRYWNSINPQHEPIDCEPEVVAAGMCRKWIAEWEAGNTNPEITEEMLKYFRETMGGDDS